MSRVLGVRALVLASASVGGVPPPRAQQGQQLDGAPKQGAAQGHNGVGNESAHDRFLAMSWRSVGPRSEVVQQPDHDPVVVEQAIDFAEESIEQGLHGGFPLADCGASAR